MVMNNQVVYVEKKHVNDIWHMTWLKRKYNSFFSQFLKLTNSFIWFLFCSGQQLVTFDSCMTNIYLVCIQIQWISNVVFGISKVQMCQSHIFIHFFSSGTNESMEMLFFFFAFVCFIFTCFQRVEIFCCHCRIRTGYYDLLFDLGDWRDFCWSVGRSVSESGKRSEWQLFSDCVTTTNYGHGDFNFNFQFKSVNCSLVVFFTDSIQQQRRTNTSKKKSKKTKHWLSVSINDVDDDVWFLQLD